MSSKEENNYKLLLAIIRSLSVNGKLQGVDWNQVANDLGLERGAAANLRWTRFKQAHGLSLTAKTAQASSGAKANKVTKAKGKGGNKAGAGVGRGKKENKMEKHEGEDGEEHALGNGNGGEENGFAEQGVENYDEKNGIKKEDGLEEQGLEIYIDEYVEGYAEEQKYYPEEQKHYGEEFQGYGFEDYGDNGYGDEV